MLGRDHLIANTASLAILSTGMATLAEQPVVSPLGALAPATTAVISAFTQYGGIDPFAVTGLGLVFFYIGTLLPDIDSEHSMLGRHIHLPMEHRTWTHAVWLPLIFTVAGFAFPPLWWAALGYVLHLFWDSLSRGGVCWFYPISRYVSYSGGAKVKRGHWLKLYSVGGVSEYILTAIIAAAGIICVYLYFDGPVPL